MTPRPWRRDNAWAKVWLAFLGMALLVHGAGFLTAPVWMPYLSHPRPLEAAALKSGLDDATPMEVVRLDDDADEPDAKEPEPEEAEPPKPLDPTGQIVEIAPPQNQERPDEADFLAEYNSTVPEETRSERFAINPEVLAPTFSKEQKIELRGEPVPDLGATAPSTGAQVGNDRFDPDRHGTLAALPGHWDATNRLGYEAPVPSAVLRSVLQGAPQNDRLDVKRGDATQLNAHEFLYTAYLNRIRRLVNFYWNQNLDNLPASVRLVKPEYTTRVLAVLDSEGSLEAIQVADDGQSGSRELDDAVVRAFRVAAPFENPPEGLIGDDGFVRLPDMAFTVTLGHASIPYQGIDPRAGVQFPGILKAPR